MNETFPNLQELENVIASLIAEGKCACHILNPHKTRILMWKKVANNQTTFYLRIGIQKFASQEQLDRNGETYWRYWSWEKKETDPKIYDKANSEQSLNPATA